MAKTIAVSGAASSGKSTLLNALQARGVQVDTFKVSRSIQSILGYENLQEALETPESMIEFQETILEVKYQNDMKLQNSTGDIILTERSFADIYAYAAINASKLVDAQLMDADDAEDFLSTYLEKCRAYQSIYAANILVPVMPGVEYVEDAQRGALEQVQLSQDIMLDFLGGIGTDGFVIRNLDLEKRVDEVLTFIA